MEKVNQADVVKVLKPSCEIDNTKLEGSAGVSKSKTNTDKFNYSVDEAKFSTPNSGAEYNSCSSSSTPERRRTLDRVGSVSSQSEALSSINMSANIASKLSQMRVSREEMENVSQSSFEEITVDESCDQPLLDGGGQGSPGVNARKHLQKTSPRVVFPHVSCLPFENNIVFCFVLSAWDNIVGPQTVYVWKRKSFPSQKTFDDLIEDRETVELGEDTVELNKSSKEKEEQIGMNNKILAEEAIGLNKQKKYGNNQSGKSLSAGDDFIKLESCTGTAVKQVLSSPLNQGSNSTCSIKEDTSSCSSVDHPSEKNIQHSKSFESFCEDIGEEILVESLKVVMDQETATIQEKTNTKCSKFENAAAAENNDSKPVPVLVLPSQSSSDNHGELEGQEFGSRWSCGRSRLRIGTVVWYVTVHSVGVGQVGPSAEKITSSLHVVPHQGIIIVAAKFTVEEEDGGVPYCLSMVVPLEEYKNFYPLTQMVTSWLVTIAATTRLLITKHGLEGGGYVKNKLVELCDVLVALRSASLDQYPLTPAGRPPDDRRLAERILTSHLQTMGSTVVVADSPNTANKVIMWIAQFSDRATLHASRLCLSYTQWPFHPGLYIQGIVRSSNGEVNLSAQKLIQSSRPLTVVDVNRGTVKHTGTPDVHARRNVSALRQELVSLWHDLPDVSVPSESLLEPVRGAAPLVKRFLHDYDRLGSCTTEVRQNFIQAFLRSLKYTALALITWTQREWSAQQRRSGYGSLRRALLSVFDMDELDLRVILAQAEILEPGFYAYVMSMSQ